MIESPRALRICVPDLATATRWYAQAFDLEPTEAHAHGVTFHVQGFTVQLVPGASGLPAPIVYWGVDDVASERQRLLALRDSADQALATLHGSSEDAVVYDPFGNAFGLTSRGDPDIRRARNQRSAEKIALRHVRETLDGLQQDEQSQRKTRRVLFLVGIVMTAALLVAVQYVAHRAKGPADEKPIAIPKLERP